MTLAPVMPKPTSWTEHLLNGYTKSPSAYSTKSSSSTASSAFSVDAVSSQSSVSSDSTGWYESRWLNDSSNQACRASSAQQWEASQAQQLLSQQNVSSLSQTITLAPEYRQHPRRTRLQPELHNGSNAPRPPPSLVRQSERKVNFVDSLVDTATQMVETIWPLSAYVQSRPSPVCVRQPSKMELRYFIQEVLKRSGASYSTLQVALYYLILIKQHVPQHDFTMEQPEDSASSFSLQCGRRMFIAALILAWKYLQDRNFSASGWRKISGLSTWDLNVNEMAFLEAIDWKLHVPDPIFQKWTDIVLKYSPSANVNGAHASRSNLCWKDVVLRLTPELDTVDLSSADLLSDDSGYDSPGSDMSPPPIPLRDMISRSEDNTPTPSPTTTTSSSGPGPSFPPDRQPPTSAAASYTPLTSTKKPTLPPPLRPHMSTLPTPNLTPQSDPFCTPAASALGVGSTSSSRRSSISRAMTQIQESCLARCTLDRTSEWKPRLPSSSSSSSSVFPALARRTSLTTTSSVSSASSPDSSFSFDNASQYSDVSSCASVRPSRTSSISSVASSSASSSALLSCAPAQQPSTSTTNCTSSSSLAVQATRRCATMQLNGNMIGRKDRDCSIMKPSCSISSEAPSQVPVETRAAAVGKRCATDLSISTLLAETPSAPTAPPAPPASETREAAAALRDLALGSGSCPQSQSQQQQQQQPRPLRRSVTTSSESRKRGRPCSMDLDHGLDLGLGVGGNDENAFDRLGNGSNDFNSGTGNAGGGGDENEREQEVISDDELPSYVTAPAHPHPHPRSATSENESGEFKKGQMVTVARKRTCAAAPSSAVSVSAPVSGPTAAVGGCGTGNRARVVKRAVTEMAGGTGRERGGWGRC